jgi:hypothetical protein
MTRTSVVVLALGAVLSLAPASAHHSFSAMYDLKRPVKVSGSVTKVDWRNPHVYFYLDATDATGKVLSYAIEVATPNQLQRNGWKRDSLKIGDKVSVEGFLARDGSLHLNGRSIVMPDGRKVFSGSADGGPGTPD